MSVCQYSLPFLFADDTNLFVHGNDVSNMVNILNDELQAITHWLKVNKLSLNVKKTHYMIFTTKKHMPTTLAIFMDGYAIDRVKHTKFLGVYIDEKLNWKQHISYLSRKISRGIGIVTKTRRVLNSNALKTLYYSFIYPYFIYCNQVWGCACKTTLYPLIILQKRCVRTITRSRKYDHTDPLFSKLNLLKLQSINTYFISKLMYKWYHDELPIVFKDIFISVSNIHNYSTRQSNELYPPSVKTDLGKHRYSYQAVIIWNKLLKAKINPDTSEYVFSKSIKHCIQIGIL